MLRPGGAYVALHEEVQGKPETLPVRLDHWLVILRWYLGILLRGSVVHGFWNIFPGPQIKRIRDRLLRKTIPPVVDTSADRTDYSEYQLNSGNFALSRMKLREVDIKPYSYLYFPKLSWLGSPLNYEMLVMKKPE